MTILRWDVGLFFLRIAAKPVPEGLPESTSSMGPTCLTHIKRKRLAEVLRRTNA